MSTFLSPTELKVQTITENKKLIGKFNIEDMKDRGRGNKRITSQLMLKVTTTVADEWHNNDTDSQTV